MKTGHTRHFGQAGRADLVRALFCSESLQIELAEQLGFDVQLPEPEHEIVDPRIQPVPEKLVVVGPEPQLDTHETAFQPQPVPFWLAKSLSDHVPEVDPVPPDDDLRLDEQSDELLSDSKTKGDRVDVVQRFDPLAPTADVVTRLRRIAEMKRSGREPDVERLVEQLSRGKQLDVIPRRLHRAWGGPGLHVISDLSRRLIPYREDQGWLCLRMQRLLNKADATFAHLREYDRLPITHWPDEARGPWKMPVEGSTVLVLGDLGALDVRNSGARSHWLHFGERLADAGVRRVALIPCTPDEVPRELRQLWKLVPWERPRSGGVRCSLEERIAGTQRLIALLAVAVSLEPQFVRRVRRALPDWRNDPGVEARIWQHPALESNNARGAAFDSKQLPQLALVRRGESQELQQYVQECLKAYRVGSYEGLWFAEILRMGCDAPGLSNAERARARRWFRSILEADDSQGERAEYYCLVQPHMSEEVESSEPVLMRLWSMFFSNDPGTAPPQPLDPSLLESKDRIQTLALGLRGGRLELRRAESASPEAASPLAIIRTRPDRVRVDYLDATTPSPSDREFDLDHDFWADGKPPSWARDWGIDEFGPYAVLEIGAGDSRVAQRMRWIPPGTFQMGSPADEPGRYEDEGPQHEVTVSRGFWMFDTPTTQAMWEAVAVAHGDDAVERQRTNPSRFKSPTRPVETVSWNDCQDFLKSLKKLVPGLDVDLPTEAEWEYACRAGTSTASYAGPVEILGKNNAPALDAVAWYGGNCGVGFDLEDGVEASGWEEKQHTFDKGGTRTVATKAPNSWGLYDMLGNVWEWCRDGQRTYADREEVDPVGPEQASAGRVIRGGSWHYYARLVRAAYRRGTTRTPGTAPLAFAAEFRGVSRAKRRRSRRQGRSER